MEYEELPPITRDRLDEVLRKGSPEEAARGLLRMALNDPDWQWAEQRCLAALHDRREDVRRAAITSFGHLARLHHCLTLQSVIPELRKLKNDPRLGGIAEDALEDILLFTSG